MHLKLGWSCITLMQNSLASFAKILVVFACLEKPQQFSSIFIARCRKNWQCLANFAKKNCHDLGKRKQKSKKFLHKKTKTPSFGDWSCLRLLFRFISCSLEKKPNTGFRDKNLQKSHLSLTSFCVILKIRKAKSSSQINSCFYSMFAKRARVNEPTLVDHVSEKFSDQLVANLP